MSGMSGSRATGPRATMSPSGAGFRGLSTGIVPTMSDEVTVTRAPSPRSRPPTGRFVTGGVVLGVGLGALADGIVLHQLLRWHHLLSATSRYPATTVDGLDANTVADGTFHAVGFLVVMVGLGLLWRAAARGELPRRGGALIGLLLAGWGGFDLVEGLVDHQLLGLHHVRDNVAHPLPWDLGFLALGALLLAAGWAIYRSAATRFGSTDRT
jgi:uncharacterized membrane protein